MRKRDIRTKPHLHTYRVEAGSTHREYLIVKAYTHEEAKYLALAECNEDSWLMLEDTAWHIQKVTEIRRKYTKGATRT